MKGGKNERYTFAMEVDGDPHGDHFYDNSDNRELSVKKISDVDFDVDQTATSLEKLQDDVLHVISSERVPPNRISASGRTWDILKMKTDDDFGPSCQEAGLSRTLLGLEIIVDNSLPVGKFRIERGDWRGKTKRK